MRSSPSSSADCALHVDLDVDQEVGHGCPGLGHPPCDRLLSAAQLLDAHSALRRAGGRLGSRRRCRGCRGWRRRLAGGLDVGLDHASPRPAALHVCQLDPKVSSHAAGHWRGVLPSIPIRRGARLRWRRPRRFGSARADRERDGALLRAGARERLAPTVARGVAEVGDHGADRERVALACDDRQHAVGVGGVGHRRLVGLDLDDLLAAPHAVPLGLQPVQDRAFLHRVRQARHDNVGHGRHTSLNVDRTAVTTWGSCGKAICSSGLE